MGEYTKEGYEYFPPETAPETGEIIYVRYEQPWRWKSYSPKSPQYKKGRKGRWQEANDYGGWENVQPNKVCREWRKDHLNKPESKHAQRIVTAVNCHDELVEALRGILDAIDAGAVKSPVVGEGRDVPPHPWHEEWAHGARQALAKANQSNNGDARG